MARSCPCLGLSPPPGCAMRFFLGFSASGHPTFSCSPRCSLFWAGISPPFSHCCPFDLVSGIRTRTQAFPPPSASSSFLPRLSSHLSVHTLLPSSISILFSPFPLSSYLTHLAHFVENSFSRGPCFTTLQLVLRCRLRSDSPSLADYFLADDVRCSSNKLIL